MIDFHVGYAKLAYPFPEVLNNHKGPFDAYGMEFIQRSPGRYLPVSKKLYNNTFHLKLIYPDVIIVQNSLHKYYQGGFNVFDFSYSEMLNTIEELYYRLGVVNVREVILNRLEFECPILVEDPQMIFRSMISFRNKPFLDLSYRGHLYGKYLETETYKLKAYSKFHQMKLEPHSYKEFLQAYPDQLGHLKKVLRLELQIKKTRFLSLDRAITIDDLYNKEMIQSIYDHLTLKFSKSIYSPSPEKIASLNEIDLASYAIMTHPNQLFNQMLKKTNKPRFDYYKRNVVNSNVQNPISELIQQKANILLE